MNLQQRWDLYHATESEKQILKTIVRASICCDEEMEIRTEG